ncbi:uncharacterized protein LOC132803787 [Ziziphus jujuba]|uniref:Uncharacterized protein LOC132803787 n=1 Tax=Ziziphus jujuba TaxID=326968 RepID=A0ABM4A993_ZIZJJ|nr:uncharacterized protein LOC132803787 [Ziziphus jujuba]
MAKWLEKSKRPSLASNGSSRRIDRGGVPIFLGYARQIAILIPNGLRHRPMTFSPPHASSTTTPLSGGLLVNIARGGMMEYESVFKFLKCGHLGGLGVDVAWREPFNPDDPILSFKNVIITPHVAGVTECSVRLVVGDVAIQLHEVTTLIGIEFMLFFVFVLPRDPSSSSSSSYSNVASPSPEK